jgi:hypothetical protein
VLDAVDDASYLARIIGCSCYRLMRPDNYEAHPLRSMVKGSWNGSQAAPAASPRIWFDLPAKSKTQSDRVLLANATAREMSRRVSGSDHPGRRRLRGGAAR